MRYSTKYTPSEQWWRKEVSSLTCAVCYRLDKKTLQSCEELHHLQTTAGFNISESLIIPLCRKHHHTKLGVHCGYPQKVLGFSELSLLGDTLRRLAMKMRPRKRSVKKPAE